MKSDVLELLTDLKAAVRIGHPESIWMALEGLFEFEPVAANAALDDTFIRKVVLPVGAALTHPMMPREIVAGLAEDANAAYRAVAAATLAGLFLKGEPALAQQLAVSGRDERAEVRDALVLALWEGGVEQLEPQVLAWLGDDSYRLQITALGLFPATDLNLDHLLPLERSPQPDLRAALVTCLTACAEQGRGTQVLTLLSSWADQVEPNTWVICKTLRGAWAVQVMQTALGILEQIGKQPEAERQITGALNALSRHGAAEAVNTTIQRWADSNDPALQTLAKRYKDD